MSGSGLRERADRVKRALTDPLAVAQALRLDVGERSAHAVKVRCPWHQEKTASCNLRLGTDGTLAVKCFGCGRSGSVLDLVAARHGLGLRGADFARVVEAGEELAGITPPSELRPPDIAAFASQRRLPLDVLRAFGVRAVIYNGRPAFR